MHCFLQIKSESKQNTTDLTYLYWAHSQWNLHHHWNIQLMKRCHLLSGMWSKGTKENKSKIFANQKSYYTGSYISKEKKKKQVSQLYLLKNLSRTKHSIYACVNVSSSELESPVRGSVLIPCCWIFQVCTGAVHLLGCLGQQVEHTDAAEWSTVGYKACLAGKLPSNSHCRCACWEEAGLLHKYQYHAGPAKRHFLRDLPCEACSDWTCFLQRKIYKTDPDNTFHSVLFAVPDAPLWGTHNSCSVNTSLGLGIWCLPR